MRSGALVEVSPMNVGNLCSRRLVKVPESAPLSAVAQLMAREHVGAVIVTAAEASQSPVTGIVTDRDIMRAQLERTADLSRLRTADIMTRNPLVIDERRTIEAAIADLRARGVRRAPVVTSDGIAVGLVSADDLLAHIASTLSQAASLLSRQRRREGTD
jgi:CBS domain-containing protein